MRRVDWTACIAIVLASMAPAACAGPRVSEPKIVAATVRDDVFPKLQIHYPDGVVARGDVEFANLTGFRPLQLDLYTPRPIKGGAPLVVWVHGGGWNRGDSRTAGGFADFPAVLASVAARGFVVASVNYRLSGEARIADQVRDIKSAVRFLRAHAADYGLDPARVYLVGGSAGGQLAALAATTCGVPAFDPPASTGRLPGSQARAAKPLPVSDCVQAAVAWSVRHEPARPSQGRAGARLRRGRLFGRRRGGQSGDLSRPRRPADAAAARRRRRSGQSRADPGLRRQAPRGGRAGGNGDPARRRPRLDRARPRLDPRRQPRRPKAHAGFSSDPGATLAHSVRPPT